MDIILTNFLPTAADTRGLSHKVITKKNVAIYGAPKFKNLKKGFPKSISGQPMILPTYDSKLRYDLDHWSNLHGIQFDVITESQDISLKQLMAANEMGLIPAATHTVVRQVQSGELCEIGQLQGIHEELLLVSAQRRIENPIAGKLMKSFDVKDMTS
jgi:LysR family transcriptional activator of nhaA